MADWPPNPNNSPNGNNNQPNQNQGQRGSNQQHNPNQKHNQVPQQYVGKEWQLIEKTMLASIEEQRKARRWNMFFKMLTFAYLLFLLFAFSKSCSQMPATTAGSTVSHVAVVDVLGTISEANEANSGTINHALTKAFEAKTSKAVVLNINSPGGSPVQSDQIWQHMRTLKKEHPDKKLYAYIGDLGASGAYYIASAADEIWVNNSSLVGSIGVIMPNFNVENLTKKLGIKDRTMTAGDHKNILSMTKPIDEFEKQHVQSVLDNVHKHFIDAVKEGRGKRLKDVEKNQTFSGLFWSGQQAIQIGLVDKTGSIRDIGKSLELDEFVNYTPQDPMKQLLKGLSVKIGEGIGSVMSEKLVEQTTGSQAQPKLQ